LSTMNSALSDLGTNPDSKEVTRHPCCFHKDIIISIILHWDKLPCLNSVTFPWVMGSILYLISSIFQSSAVTYSTRVCQIPGARIVSLLKDIMCLSRSEWDKTTTMCVIARDMKMCNSSCRGHSPVGTQVCCKNSSRITIGHSTALAYHFHGTYVLACTF
jgi:hypothetical protein